MKSDDGEKENAMRIPSHVSERMSVQWVELCCPNWKHLLSHFATKHTSVSLNWIAVKIQLRSVNHCFISFFFKSLVPPKDVSFLEGKTTPLLKVCMVWGFKAMAFLLRSAWGQKHLPAQFIMPRECTQMIYKSDVKRNESVSKLLTLVYDSHGGCTPLHSQFDTKHIMGHAGGRWWAVQGTRTHTHIDKKRLFCKKQTLLFCSLTLCFLKVFMVKQKVQEKQTGWVALKQSDQMTDQLN